MPARFKIGPTRIEVPGEWRTDVTDRTCVVGSVAWDGGADYYCVYGPTPQAAINAACEHIADGGTLAHFVAERELYLRLHGPEGWDAPTETYAKEHGLIP